MNHSKWQKVKDPAILVAKLTEETGEVAKAFLDGFEADTVVGRSNADKNLAEELEHVEFIIGRIRDVAILGI